MQRRVLVCGGRDYTNREKAFSVLDAAHAADPIGEVIHGAAAGADHVAGEWASARTIPARPFPADWIKHGRAAGPSRNLQMLTDGMPDLVIAFPGGRGTANMIKQAKAHGVPVVTIGPD